MVEEIAAKTTRRKPRWLPALEQEMRRRMGWVDEAISPFARGGVPRRPARIARTGPLLFPHDARKSA